MQTSKHEKSAERPAKFLKGNKPITPCSRLM